MYAIVEMAGQQFKVAKDQKVFVHRLQGNEGDQVTFDKVLLIDDATITIGAPAIDGAAVVAKILGHQKGDKVIIFKKKRRKGYRKKNGHRQSFTQILIESIVASGYKVDKVVAKAVKQDTPKAEVVSEVVVSEVVETVKAETKKASPKKKVETSVEETPKVAKKPATKKAPKTEE
jgi:large subunit ribosomal protein L21